MKSRFMIDTFRFLDNEAKRLVEDAKTKGKSSVNGNMINAVIKKVRKSAYDTDYWFGGELSQHYIDYYGNPEKVQVNMPNWYAYLCERIKKHTK